MPTQNWDGWLVRWFIFVMTCLLFPTVAAPISVPTSSAQGSLFCTCSVALRICCIFHGRRSDRCEVLSRFCLLA